MLTRSMAILADDARDLRGELDRQTKAGLAGARMPELPSLDDLVEELNSLQASVRNWRLARDLTTTQLGGTPC